MRVCDACGRDCTSVTGVLIQWNDSIEKCKEVTDVQEMFGKTEFSICLICYLLSLGVRPKEGGD